MLKQYCVKCHNAEDWAGGVAFDTMTPEEIPEQGDVWEHAVRKLRGRLMPPPGKPQPDAATIHAFVSWMENTLDAAAASHPDPGRVALHRLNRKEYANAVRDLLHVPVDPNTILPQDDRSDGFDNVASVLQVSPSFLDQYLSAARGIAVDAVGEIPEHPSGVQYVVKTPATQSFHIDGLPLGTRGGMVVSHEFPADGEYELNIGNLAVALWVYNMEFKNTLIATLDGKKFWQADLGGEEDMKAIDQKQDPAVDAINARLKGIRFKATAGPHEVAVTFLHRTFAESDDRLYQQIPGGGQDRILRLGNFEVKGPFSPTGISETPSRQRIFVCRPTGTADEDACAEKIVTSLAREAFRRPVTEGDMKLLMRFYRDGRREKDFDTGIREVVTAVLASPFFLYRAERTPAELVAHVFFWWRGCGNGRLSDQRSRVGLAIVVLPLEHRTGRRAVEPGNPEQTARFPGARRAGASHAGGSEVHHPVHQLRVPMAGFGPIGRDSAGPEHLSVCRRSPSGLSHGNEAVRG